MLIRPELQALRGDDTPQRHAQADMRRLVTQWRSSGGGAGIELALASFARGTPLAELPPLARLFVPGNPAGLKLAHDMIDRFAAVLAAAPWGQVPLPAKLDDVTATIVLASAGNAALVLQAIDGAGLRRRPPALTASFSPGETHDRILAGHAEARLIELRGETEQGADLTATCFALRPGQVFRRDGARQSLLIDAAPTTLVTLKLQRRPATGSVTREFCLAEGTLAHQAAGNARESRFELAAALLGRMGRSDAAPLLGAMAEEQGAGSLRWQALRECLGLDTAEGFAVLGGMAGRVGDPLAAPAAALQTQLLQSYPQLAGAASCPA